MLIRLPVVYNAGGDLSKKWFIEFYVRNSRTGRLERQRKARGINKYHTFKERTQAAQKMKQYWTDKLKAGWTPFTNELVVYDDNLEYQTVVKNYRAAKSRNGTWRFFASKFLDSIKNKVEESTVSTYRSKLRMFDAWLEGQDMNDADISAVSHKVVVNFFLFLIEERMLSKESVSNYRQIITAVFEYVRKERKHLVNPCYDLPETKRKNDSAPQPIQEFDIAVFRDGIEPEDPQLWMAVCFEYYCFLRPGKELRLLQLGDIDFGRGVIRVRANNAKTVERYVSVPEKFLQQLREKYKLHEYPRRYFVFGQNGKPGVNHLGKNNLRFRFNKFRKQLGMPEMYKFYSWKHTGNIRADEAGIPRSELQNQNGHTSLQTTEIYIKNKRGHKSQGIVKNFPEL